MTPCHDWDTLRPEACTCRTWRERDACSENCSPQDIRGLVRALYRAHRRERHWTLIAQDVAWGGSPWVMM